MPSQIKRWLSPPQWYRRYRPWWHRVGPALLMAGLFWGLAHATQTLPSDWQNFLAVGLFLTGLLTPKGGQLAFVLLSGVVLYLISIYVAVLGLLVLLPMWFFGTPETFNRLLGILAMPWLVPYRLALSIPLLMALFWPGAGSIWGGFIGAWWLKVLANMNDLPADLLLLEGQHFSGTAIATRFHHANSLQTVLWMFAPLAPNPHILLQHLLQSLGWGLATLGLGGLRTVHGSPWKRFLLPTAGALIGLWTGCWVFPWALKLSATWQPPAWWAGVALLNILTTWSLFALYRYLEGTGKTIEPFAGPLFPKNTLQAHIPPSEPLKTSPPLVPRPAPPHEHREQDIIKLDLD